MSSVALNNSVAGAASQPKAVQAGKNWVQNQPTVIKILKIALLIIGIGALFAAPFVATLIPVWAVLTLIGGGLVSLVASKVLYAKDEALKKSSSPTPESPASRQSPSPAALPPAPPKVAAPALPPASPQAAPVVPLVAAQQPPAPAALPPAPPRVAAPALPPAPPRAAPAQQPAAPAAHAPLSKEQLWNLLGQKTINNLPHLKIAAQLQGIGYLGPNEVNHRYVNVAYARDTAVTVRGKLYPANRVGEGIAVRKMIATQAPLPADFEAFWQMVFDKDGAIIDLTTPQDVNDGKADKYYPDLNQNPSEFGSVKVKCTKIEKKNFREFEVECGGVTKTIRRLRVTDVPDGTAPDLNVLRNILTTIKDNYPDQLVIHCSAGIGRTGIVIAGLTLEEAVANGTVTLANLDEKLTDLVAALRKQREPGFVSTDDQLELLRQYGRSLLGAN